MKCFLEFSWDPFEVTAEAAFAIEDPCGDIYFPKVWTPHNYTISMSSEAQGDVSNLL